MYRTLVVQMYYTKVSRTSDEELNGSAVVGTSRGRQEIHLINVINSGPEANPHSDRANMRRSLTLN